MTITGIAVADSPHHKPSSFWLDLIPIAITSAIFSFWSISWARTSEGFLETDSITHYLYARFALLEPHYLVNVWGRPLVTGLYALPALFYGRAGVQTTSLVLALTCALVAYVIARRQEYRWPVLAFVFTLAQPLVFLHSFSELTELPFAALLGLAFLAYRCRQFLLMTLLISVSPLARPEGFGFLLLAAGALLLHRRWWWIPLLAVPLLMWDHAGWVRFGRPPYPTQLPQSLQWLLWLKHEWPYAADSLYDRKSIFHFVLLLPAIVSPLLFPATCVGLWRCMRDGLSLIRRRVIENRPLFEFLIAAIPILILVGHSILCATGKMASSGEMRYMLIVAPFWGLLSARGWTWIWERMNWRLPLIFAAAASLAPILINSTHIIGSTTVGYRILPLMLNKDMITARRFARWYRVWLLRNEYPRVLAAHPGVYYFLDRSPTARLSSREWNKQTIAQASKGTILIWDRVSGLFNSDQNRSVGLDEIEKAGWVLDEEASNIINDEDAADDDLFYVFLSPQSDSDAPTEDVLNLSGPPPLSQ